MPSEIAGSLGAKPSGFHGGRPSRPALTNIDELDAIKARASPAYNVLSVTPFWERQLAVAGMIRG
jgi:hypothetical protein